MNLYYTICIKCMNYMNLYYTICIKYVRIIWIRMYEFVQKLAKKKRNQVGISTQDQYGLQSSQRHAIHHPAASISGHFIYIPKIRTPSENWVAYSHPLNFLVKFLVVLDPTYICTYDVPERMHLAGNQKPGLREPFNWLGPWLFSDPGRSAEHSFAMNP